jgi:hypothetical protein
MIMNTQTSSIEHHCLSNFTRSHRRWWGLGLGLWLGLGANSLWAQPAPPEVLNAASNGLPAFLASVSLGNRELYGFTNDTDLAQARLGVPLRVHTITPKALASHPVESTLAPLLSETVLWYFPVLVGDETKAILVVDSMAGEWQAVSIGYAPLAQELHQIAKQWPAGAGYHPRLVAAFSANRYYFTVPEVDDHNLTPIVMPGQADETGSPPGTSQTRYSTLTPLSQSTAQLKAAFDHLPAKPAN